MALMPLAQQTQLHDGLVFPGDAFFTVTNGKVVERVSDGAYRTLAGAAFLAEEGSRLLFPLAECSATRPGALAAAAQRQAANLAATGDAEE